MPGKRGKGIQCPVCLKVVKKSTFSAHKKTHIAKLGPLSEAIRSTAIKIRGK